jgi:hypothetical protein
MAKTPRRFSIAIFLSLISLAVFPRTMCAANNPVPFINDPLMPSAVAPGGPTFTLTVNGSNFIADSVVKWNGTALTTTFVSSSQLTATVPSTLTASASSGSVTVTNPTPGGGTSLPGYVRVAPPVTTPAFVSYLQGTGFFPGHGVESFVTADFNADGKLDVAFLVNNQTSSTTMGSVCIMLGKGDGSFQTPICQQGTIGQFLSQISVGDFNGDGKLDLAVASSTGISLFPGNGDGTLGSPISSAAGGGPLLVVAADFNRDGNLDLAVVNFIEGSTTNTTFIAILLGNGNGTFQAPVNYATGFNAFSLATGDFNRDGNLDLVFNNVAGTGPTTVYFMAGKGDGTFQNPQAGQVLTEFDNITYAVDVNGDGKLDLLVEDNDADNSVLLGNGDGTFQTANSINSPNINGVGPQSVSADDINADGKLDLSFIIGNASGASEVNFQLGNGDGTFGGVSNLPAPPAATAYPYGIVTGDFNGDGRVDIFVDANCISGIGPAAFLVYLQGSFPVISPSLATLNFPQQALGIGSGPQSLTLTNNSTSTVTLSGVSFSGTGATSFGQTNNCGTTIAGGASCQVNVTFDPPTAGNVGVFMNIASNAVNNPAIVYLSGSTAGPAASLSPASVTFPSQYVGTSGNPQSVTVTNNGTSTLVITNVAASPSDFAALNACGSSLAVGASCAIGVFFDPTAGGARSGTLTITDNAGTPQTVALSGTGQDFSMTAGSGSSATISAGQTASYSISVAPAGGFTQSVALSCTGGPSGSNCTVSPATLALSGSSAQTVKVSVTTPAAGAVPAVFTWRTNGNFPSRMVIASVRLAIAFFIVVALLGMWIRRRNQRLHCVPALVFGLVLAACVTMASCGGGSNGGGSNGGGGTGPEAGTYTVTVSGNFSSGTTKLTHNTNLTLVVQ